ncbi:starvation-inducible DNA-binding protein [Algoriphagus sp. 4150]|uniref:Dps family protein n=1 Tax=Algoriphagus sp. 4150 TaxID=2817756 RepID=UPI00285AEB86|nr:DNA starvation/stationary phase protection protein [Algoriphagus sp. 4150]MDR7128116.1 starvation-inducible DNA-binding protein [Algoriphagus sp. 4150]
MKIGISENNAKKVAMELSKLLADEFVLYTKTKQAHWNVEGPDFYGKHKLFDELAIQLASIIDLVAERIRILNFAAPATLKSFLELTHLTEDNSDTKNSKYFIEELLSDHEVIILQLRGNIESFGNESEDLGTSDFITSLMQEHEKIAWLLRAHLK